MQATNSRSPVSLTALLLCALQLYVQPLLHDSASRSPTIGKVCGLSSADKVTSMSDFLHSVEPLHTLNAQLLTAMADKVRDHNTHSPQELCNKTPSRLPWLPKGA